MDDCRKGARASRLLVRHNDASREWAYARNPSIGQLDEANARGWTVVDMNDWQRVFPFEQNVSRAVWKGTRVANR